MENKHTPTPWHLVGTEIRAHNDSENTIIGEIYTEANAAFIFKAVNNHDALVEYLKWFRKYAMDVRNAILTGEQVKIIHIDDLDDMKIALQSLTPAGGKE